MMMQCAENKQRSRTMGEVLSLERWNGILRDVFLNKQTVTYTYTYTYVYTDEIGIYIGTTNSICYAYVVRVHTRTLR